MTKEQLENDCYLCPYEKTICFDETPDKWDLIALTYKLSQGGGQNGN